MQNLTLAKPFNPMRRADDEIGVRDIVQFFKQGKRWIIGTFLVCLLLGGTYVLLVPPRYEASANIEMATVAGTPVEAPNILAEKLKLPLYYSAGTYKVCGVEGELPSPGQFLANQLKPVVNKNAPIVSVKFRAKTTSDAKKCLESVIVDVKKSQNSLSKPIIDKKNVQLQTLLQKLKDAENLLTLLTESQVKFGINDSKSSVDTMLLATVLAKESEIKDLRNQINEMQISLTEPHTRNTTLVTPIYASDSKVEPKRALVMLFSAFGGLLLGVLLFAGRKFLAVSGARN